MSGIAWSTRLSEYMLERNDDGSNMMGGDLQLPMRGKTPHQVPQREWEEDKGISWFRKQLIPSVYWVTGNSDKSRFFHEEANISFKIHIHKLPPINRKLKITWSPERGAKGGWQNITLELPLDLLNQPGEDIDFIVVAGDKGNSIGDFITIFRSAEDFHLVISDPCPTMSQLSEL